MTGENASTWSPARSRLTGEVKNQLSCVLRRDRLFEDARGRLAKFGRNFSFDSTARGILNAVEFSTMVVENNSGSLGLIALNSPTVDESALLTVAENHRRHTVQALSALGIARSNALWSGTETRTSAEGSPLSHIVYGLDQRPENSERALSIVAGLSNSTLPASQRAIVSNLCIQCTLAIGEWKEAVGYISKEIIHCEDSISIVPIKETLSERNWDVLNGIDDKLDLAISLFALWKQTDEGIHATFVRFSFEEVLFQQGVQFPADISSEKVNCDSRVRYLLSNICVPVLMDSSGFFVSSEELLDQRLKVISLLEDSGAGMTDDLREEAAGIQTDKLIRSGLKIVDTNRVTVDENAIERWATRKYREAYYRYLALKSAGIGSEARFVDIIEQLRAVTDTHGEYFSIPNSEADTLLLEVVLGVRDRMLEDPQYGLEYFLGKRIRHGTVARHMRGPVERTRLITERRGPNFPYEPNEHWLGKMSFGSDAQREQAVTAFSSFSEEYDRLIAEVRDVYLHVKSDQHPQGLFILPITAPQFHIIKTFLKGNIDFEDFFNFLIHLFWRLLGSCLSSARDYLSVTVKERVVVLFGELQNSLKEIGNSDDNLRQAEVIVQSVCTEVQRELDVVASWFDRADEQHGVRTFTLDQAVEVAIHASLNSLTMFRPSFSRNINGGLVTSSAVMIVLWEFLFVVLDNVYQRARVGSNPELELDCCLDVERRTLRVYVENPVGEHVDLTDVERRLQKIREKITAGDIVPGAAADKGSGLLKMAPLNKDFAGSTLNFGLRPSRRFMTEMTFPVNIINDTFSLTLTDHE